MSASIARSFAPGTRYALVSFDAPEAPAKEGRRPVNVALVLDRPGSMGGEEIRLAREAVRATGRRPCSRRRASASCSTRATMQSVRQIAEELRESFEVLSAPMASMAMKSAHAASYNVMTLRDETGKARRRPPGAQRDRTCVQARRK